MNGTALRKRIAWIKQPAQLSVTVYFSCLYLMLLILLYDDSIWRTLVNYVGTLLLCLILFRTKDIKIRFPRHMKSVIFAYLLFWAVSVLVSLFGTNLTTSLANNLKTIMVLFIALSIFLLLRKEKFEKLLINSFFLLGIVFIIGQLKEILLNPDDIRLGGFISNINVMGYIYSALVFLALLQYFYTRKKRLIVLMVLYAVGLLMTMSRAAILFCGVLVIYLFFTKVFDKRLKLICIAAVAILLCSLPWTYSWIMTKLIRSGSGLAGRDYLWENACNIIRDHFWTGVGAGNMKEVAQEYLLRLPDISDWRLETLFDYASQSSHNMYLDILVENGIFGLLALAVLVFMYFRQFIHYLRTSKDYVIRGTSHCMIALMLGILARNFFEPMGLIGKAWVGVDIIFWIFYALAVSVIIRRKQFLVRRVSNGN